MKDIRLLKALFSTIFIQYRNNIDMNDPCYDDDPTYSGVIRGMTLEQIYMVIEEFEKAESLDDQVILKIAKNLPIPDPTTVI